MRRALPLIATLAMLAVPASAIAQDDDAPPLRAAVTACQTGLDAASRSAAFTASMPARGDTVRMAIRFDLQQRTVDGGVWQRVSAPRFGRWERSRSGVAGFVYTKDVHGLSAPGEYRAIVRLRWYAQDGTTRTVRRVTRTCRQPDARPVLAAGRLRMTPAAADPALAGYRVRVRNEGLLPAGAFAVALELDGAEAGRASVAGLAPDAATTVAITAPRCADDTVLELQLDADGELDGATPGGVTVRRACPAGGAAEHG
jgi:hypothetical protein